MKSQRVSNGLEIRYLYRSIEKSVSDSYVILSRPTLISILTRLSESYNFAPPPPLPFIISSTPISLVMSIHVSRRLGNLCL